QRSHQWRSRGGSVAAIARNTLCKRRHWRVGHVNQRVVDGNLAARIGDSSGDGSGGAVGGRKPVAMGGGARPVSTTASLSAANAAAGRKTALAVQATLAVHANPAAGAVGIRLANFCDLSAVTSGQN